MALWTSHFLVVAVICVRVPPSRCRKALLHHLRRRCGEDNVALASVVLQVSLVVAVDALACLRTWQRQQFRLPAAAMMNIP